MDYFCQHTCCGMWCGEGDIGGCHANPHSGPMLSLSKAKNHPMKSMLAGGAVVIYCVISVNGDEVSMWKQLLFWVLSTQGW